MNEREINERFESIEKRLDSLEGNKEDIVTKKHKKKSIKEFLIEKSPEDDVRRALCIAHYLEIFEGKEESSSKDISEGFRDAKLKVPSNVADKIQQATRKGWLAPGKENGKFYVTTTGEEIIGNGFNKK